MLFLSGGHFYVRMGYTLPQAIKEEKKDEERVGNLDWKREKAGKLKVKKRNEREGSGGFWVSGFLFIFCLGRKTRENTVTGEGGFPFH